MFFIKEESNTIKNAKEKINTPELTQADKVGLKIITCVGMAASDILNMKKIDDKIKAISNFSIGIGIAADNTLLQLAEQLVKILIILNKGRLDELKELMLNMLVSIGVYADDRLDALKFQGAITLPSKYDC